MSMSEAFARAYKDGQWHNGSGSGSSPANTIEYRTFLELYMRSRGVRSVLDVGCGDWQFSRLIDWTGIDYTGIDAVSGIVGANGVRYGRRHIAFYCEDVLEHGANGENLPSYDLILVKDLFQHWPDSAIHQMRDLLRDRRALLTYDLTTGPHTDIEAGGYRALDLTAQPFAWPVRERLRYTSWSHGGRVARTKVVMEMTP